MVAGAGGGVRHVATVLDRLARSVRRNMGSRGSPLHRRNGNQVRPDAPLASGRPGRSDQAGWSCPRFQGWAWPEPDGAAEREELALADRPVPDEGIRPGPPTRSSADPMKGWASAVMVLHSPCSAQVPELALGQALPPAGVVCWVQQAWQRPVPLSSAPVWVPQRQASWSPCFRLLLQGKVAI